MNDVLAGGLDAGLVILSGLAATLALYLAIDFPRPLRTRRPLWLGLGGLAAGSGAGAVAAAAGWASAPFAALAGAYTALALGLAAWTLRTQTHRALVRQRGEQALRAQVLALHDPATGLRNRASFQQEIVRLIQRCRRESRQFDLIHCRIGFSALRPDQLDDAMRALATRVSGLQRDGDVLARFARTEFALLRPRHHLGDRPDAVHAALLDACTATLTLGTAALTPQAQVGIGTFPDHGHGSHELLSAAARHAGAAEAPARVA